MAVSDTAARVDHGPAIGWPLRLFVTSADEPRSRRASDVVLLVTSVVALGAASLTAGPPPSLLASFDRLLANVPSALDGLSEVLVDLVALVALLVPWTFHLPPVRGRFAFGWLERNDHL